MTSVSHQCPGLMHNYEEAVTRLTNVLRTLEIKEFYTHHVDLLHHCITCPGFPQDLVDQLLDVWLIESDGDIKPLLPFGCDKVVRRLLASRELRDIGLNSRSYLMLFTRKLRLCDRVEFASLREKRYLSVWRVSVSDIVIFITTSVEKSFASVRGL